ncbi:MAG: hypothetical protein KA191_03485 [Verrucomicrobia bacterium]|jgi:hypothetical protein|nr:hypothetical protein [Verrucomicrobiota bacterium]OQC66769.1 MAG: hypothetical protein BWX48_01355 [Verrucomicrobia bacterium ADurb.Bin006]MDI9381572.1 hypothetical protein [Verrucomicrobiota bacterium]NMD22371.1 hypothetical protein [Verrucomicrobiota bacterium]HNU98334.1 hypothetical protein [Verrucomicrobiota bacterium]
MKPILRVVRGQPSWRVASADVEAFVTRMGGQIGPVTFDRRGRRVQPFAVAPWAEEEEAAALPPILRALRGDFFCLPFGGNAKPFGKERHPLHGETANASWTLESLEKKGAASILHLSLSTKARRGRVDKFITLVDGHQAVYARHRISGMKGPMCLGHHAMLRFPDHAGSGTVSTSPFLLGQVLPEPTERPEQRGYSLLKPGAEFASLENVPTITGETADLSRYPARRGFEDLALIVSDSAAPFAWTAVTFPRERYVWIGLKDPRVLRSTLFWFSNCGRHYPPWSGRHVNVMGLEEVTSYFHYGLAESARKNTLSRRGYATSIRLNPDRPLEVNYIMAVSSIPSGFDRVAAVDRSPRAGEGLLVRSASGKTLTIALDIDFLGGGNAGSEVSNGPSLSEGRSRRRA